MKRLHLVHRGANKRNQHQQPDDSPHTNAKYRHSVSSRSTCRKIWAAFLVLTFLLSNWFCYYYYYEGVSLRADNAVLKRSVAFNSDRDETFIEHSAAEGFAACILIKDDNPRLIEWIAYHFQVLPLRSLIVALDPNSVTSPLSILQRWNSSTELQTILWTDDDYMSKDTQILMEYKSQCHANRVEEVIGVTHRKRQNVFQSACAQFHKRQNRSWVAFIDTDEFITFNTINIDKEAPQNSSSLLSIRGSTIWEYIYNFSFKWDVCVGMARVLFISSEEQNKTKLYEGAVGLPSSSSLLGNPTVFDTLRFFYHARLSEQSTLGKSLVDVSRVSYEDLAFTSFGAKVRVNAHRPFLICDPSVTNVDYDTSHFRVQHYLGNWDAYSARSDLRRQKEKFQEKNNPANIAGPIYDAQPWLKAFVKSMGSTEVATKFLRGVGGEYGYGKRYKEPEEAAVVSRPCALLFYGNVPITSFTGIILSSIQSNIVDIHPSCHIYAHTYDSSSISEEMLLPIIKANPEQANSKNFVMDSASVLSKTYSEFLDDSTSAIDFVGKWHSVERVWDCMSQAEAEQGRFYETVGIFALDARYINRIVLKEGDTLNALVISRNKDGGFNSRAVYGARGEVYLWATDRFRMAKDFVNGESIGPYLTQNMDSFAEYFVYFKMISIHVRNDICAHSVLSTGDLAISDCRCRELHELMKEIGKEEDRVEMKLSLR